MKRTAATPDTRQQGLNLALASASLLTLTALPAAAHAAQPEATPSTTGVYVTILSPNPGTALTGAKHVEITAYYESSYGVADLDLYIDGRHLATQRLSTPETKGEISFVLDSSALSAGPHAIVVRATATDAEVASARTLLQLPSAARGDINAYKGLPSPSGSISADQDGAPSVAVVSPAPNATVSGIVRIKVNATDPSGEPPYVSLFVDHDFKTLRNFQPYTFTWDTSRLANGVHTIEVWAYDDAQKVSHAQPFTVIVNNPGGRTFERTDLSDTVSAAHRAWTSRPKDDSARRIVVRAKPHRAASAAVSLKRSALKKSAGLPIVAGMRSDAISGMLARAQQLASLGDAGAPLGAASIDETLMAPILGNRSIAAAAQAAMPMSSAVISHAPAHAVPGLRNAVGRPLLSSGALRFARPAAPLETISATAGEWSIGELIAAPGSRAGVVGKLAARPASRGAELSPVRSKLSFSAAKLSDKLVQIASANIDASDGSVYGARRIIAPLAAVRAAAARMAPLLARHRIELASVGPRTAERLRGAFQVVVDGQRLQLQQPLQDRGAVLYAPLRQIFENEGGALEWDAAKRRVRAYSASREIVVTIGSRQAMVNNKRVRLDAAPYLYNDRTMLPLDFFPKTMDAKVTYDAATGHLVIESGS